MWGNICVKYWLICLMQIWLQAEQKATSTAMMNDFFGHWSVIDQRCYLSPTLIMQITSPLRFTQFIILENPTWPGRLLHWAVPFSENNPAPRGETYKWCNNMYMWLAMGCVHWVKYYAVSGRRRRHEADGSGMIAMYKTGRRQWRHSEKGWRIWRQSYLQQHSNCRDLTASSSDARLWQLLLKMLLGCAWFGCRHFLFLITLCLHIDAGLLGVLFVLERHVWDNTE